MESFARMPSLLLLAADGESVEREVELAAAEVTIGRDFDSGLVLFEEKVSRRHARVVPDGGGWTVKDEGSANGVFLNGRRVREQRLAPGDVISVGGREIRFADEDAATVTDSAARKRPHGVSGSRPRTRRHAAVTPRPGVPAWALAAALLVALGGLGGVFVYASRGLWLPLLGPRPAARPSAVVPRSTLPPPGVLEFGRFAQQRELRTLALSPEAREHALGDTVRLLVPAGAVRDTQPCDATVFELPLRELSTRVHSARVYVLQAAEGARLSKPLTLEIAWPSAKASVAVHTAAGWRTVRVSDGPSTRVAVDGLARHTVAVVEWEEVPAAGGPAGQAEWPLPRARSREDEHTKAPPVGAGLRGGREELCAELADRVLAYPNVTFARPQLRGAPVPAPQRGLPRGDPFAALVVDGRAPRELGGNVYVRLTAEPAGDGDRRSREQRLEQAILASDAELRPGDMMALALRACDGSYPLATLTAYNLISGLAAAGRGDEIAAKLVDLRIGSTGRLVPWSHAFVPLAVAAWTGDPDEADAALAREYALRFLAALSGTGTLPSVDLQASSRCFARAARTIHARRAEAEPALSALAPAAAGAPGRAAGLAGEAELKLVPFEPVLVSADAGEAPDPRSDLQRRICIPGVAGSSRIRVAKDGSFVGDCTLDRSEPGDRATTSGRLSGELHPAGGELAFSGGCAQQQEFALHAGGPLQRVNSTTAYRAVVRRIERDRQGRPASAAGKLRYDHQLTTASGELRRYTAEVPFVMSFRYD